MATTATVAVTTVGPPSAAAAAHGSEEEIAKKKSTDCVYFLASPLTCKKGDDCEFRHSESARLNPRDCWYWVGGNCRNRDCPFRHPPIETRPAAAAPPPAPAVQKKPVPCYFFSQGCCAKGSKCQFLHENPSTNAMVYRLSDSSKSTTLDSVKTKPETSAPEAGQHLQQSQTPDKRKDNVYRLQDDPKKGKPTPPPAAAAPAAAAAGPSRESSEDLNNDRDSRNRSGKSHKDSFTWKLSDCPAAQKQPASGAATSAAETGRKAEKHSRKQSSSSSESDKKRRETPPSRGSSERGEGAEMVAEDFAGPKSLAQIKEEKRSKSEDGGDEPSSAYKATKRKSDAQGGGGGGAAGDRVRRKLCNGTGTSGGDGDGNAGGEGDAGGAEGDGDGDGDGSGGEINGGDAVMLADDDDEAFTRKLAGLL